MQNLGKLLFLLTIILIVCFFAFRRSADDYMKSGNAKFSKRDFDGAIIDYTKAIRIKPLDAASDGAKVDFAKALELELKMNAQSSSP